MLNVVELDQLILMKLPVTALGNIAQVNCNLHKISSNDYFWKEKCKRDFGPITHIKPRDVPHMKYYRDLWESKYPQIAHAEKAAETGRLRELEWLLERGIKATFKGANRAARNGYLDTLQWLYDKYKVLPDIIGANWAGSRAHLHVLKWLNKHNVHMDIHGIKIVERNNHHAIMEWLVSKLP